MVEEAAGVLRRQPVDDAQQAFRRLTRGPDLEARLRERRRQAGVDRPGMQGHADGRRAPAPELDRRRPHQLVEAASEAR